MNRIIHGDCLTELKKLQSNSVQCVVTSPPYWGLRDYGVADQLGLEPTPELYVANMVGVFREVKRVLRDDGTVWLNLGDSYYGGGWKGSQTDLTETKQGTNAGTLCGKDMKKDLPHKIIKTKDLVGIPWMVAFALRADGWYLRQDIIWAKPNPMPESVTDRCTKAHEYVFLLTKSSKYYYDAEVVKEDSVDPESHKGRNKRNPYKGVGEKGFEVRDGFHQIENGKTYPTRNKRSVWDCEENEYLQFLKWKAEQDQNKPDVWRVSTQPYPGAHFATFPPKLIEPCILAGSSHKACEVCGGAWERVTEKEPMEIKRSGRGDEMGEYGRTAASGTMTKPAAATTTGWQPTCQCLGSLVGEDGAPTDGIYFCEDCGIWEHISNLASGCPKCGETMTPAPPKPTRRSIVLDPFAGSGTTLMVAEDNGRDSIGIELNSEYCELIKQRMNELQPRLFHGGTV